MFLRVLVILLRSLQLYGIVYQGGEIRKVMDSHSKLQIRVKSFTKLLLTAGICRYIFLGIARQFQELSLIRFHRLSSLGEVAKLTLLPVHYPLRDITGAESILEVHP